MTPIKSSTVLKNHVRGDTHMTSTLSRVGGVEGGGVKAKMR